MCIEKSLIQNSLEIVIIFTFDGLSRIVIIFKFDGLVDGSSLYDNTKDEGFVYCIMFLFSVFSVIHFLKKFFIFQFAKRSRDL